MDARGYSRTTISQELGLSMTTVNRVIRAHHGQPSPVSVLKGMKAKARARKLVEVDQWLVTK